jgi:hypothetical protein
MQSAPISVKLGLLSCAAGLVINHLVIVALDLPGLTRQSDPNFPWGFILAHLTIVPIFTSPFWAPQLLFLILSCRAGWSRYVLALTLVPVWYFLLGPSAFDTAFHTLARYPKPELPATYVARAIAAGMQLCGLCAVFSKNSGQYYAAEKS